LRVLVTGHLGYIGPHAVDLLVRAGHDVTGVDLDLFPESALYPSVEPQTSRVLDFRDLAVDDLRGFDAIVHLAAISNDSMGTLDPELTRQVNLRGTVELARRAKRAGVPLFLQASSCSVYGKTDDRPIAEDGRPAPITVYAETKIAVERELSALADATFSPVYLRNATAYGASPRLRLDLVLNNLLASAYATGVIRVLSDGTPWRPLIHCRDIARAFVFFLTAAREAIHDQAFNVGSSTETYQVRDVARLVGELLPESALSFAEGAGPDPRDYKVDFGKLERTFPEFRLEYDLERGARELLADFRRYGLPPDCLQSPRFIRLRALERRLAEGAIAIEPAAERAAPAISAGTA
jgi:nucleoside-diphosphate-sugar epimerase